MALAIFDLDNTLINGDSDSAWGDFLVRKGYVDSKEYQKRNHEFHQHYLNGTLNILDYLEFCLKVLSEHPQSVLNAWHQEFMAEVIEPMMQDKAFERIQFHQDQGDVVMIITATNQFVTQPIAKRLGIDILIATEAEEVDGRFTGKVAGVPSFQAGKITRLEAWLKDQPYSLEGAWFYSDSHNDLPLLQLVDHPVVVDGDERLLAHAHAKGWTCLSFHND